MKLISCEKTTLEFDKEAKAVRMVFERDGKRVSKVAAVSHAARICAKDKSYRKELALQVAKVSREADRDLAYMIYGDKWREHCVFQSNFWGPILKEELDKVLQ